jgi:aspartate carbamoyltransferase catalytic subunit
LVNTLYLRDIISIQDLEREDLERIFKVTDRIESLEIKELQTIAEGKTLGTMFFEPSTRTRLSFEAAMNLLGGNVLGFSEARNTSVEKGETLADTVRMIDCYSDAIVLRHPSEGAARYAAEIASKPVISGGSGTEEHPTQAIVDLYTIVKEKRKIDGLKIAIVGDLKYGRTVYSLLYALAKFNPHIYLVSPVELKIREDPLLELGGKLRLSQHTNIEEVIGDVDVLYVTRIQKERFPDAHDYERVRGSYIVDLPLLEKGKENLIVMHPLPRLDEIATEVDKSKNAKYFVQASRARTVRAALLTLILSEQPPY